MKKSIILYIMLLVAVSAQAEDYDIDNAGAHAFIQFKIKHLGYSWLLGRFNTFGGEFSYAENNPSAAKIVVNIDVASIDSNHAERDKHLKGKDFLHVSKYPEAKFISTSFRELGKGKIELKGKFTLHGLTKPITINAEHIGHGPDPWGGHRRGFSGTTTLKLKDYGINYDLGPASAEVELYLFVEGVRKK